MNPNPLRATDVPPSGVAEDVNSCKYPDSAEEGANPDIAKYHGDEPCLIRSELSAKTDNMKQETFEDRALLIATIRSSHIAEEVVYAIP